MNEKHDLLRVYVLLLKKRKKELDEENSILPLWNESTIPCLMSW